MTEKEVLQHWKYFLTLEKDLIRLKDYVEIHPDNFETYSFELSKLLQLSCSEIDSVCRLLSKAIDPKVTYDDETTRGGNIATYRNIIMGTYPQITTVNINIPDIGDIQPWQEWTTVNKPGWWDDYNKVKHYRHSSFKKANLKNVLYALTALETMIMYLYRHILNKKHATPTPFPKYLDSEYFAPYFMCRPNKELPDFE